jgi:hypothetical protein
MTALEGVGELRVAHNDLEGIVIAERIRPDGYMLDRCGFLP